MSRLAKPKSNKANSFNLYPKTKGYLRETRISQNINLTSPTPKFKTVTISNTRNIRISYGCVYT